MRSNELLTALGKLKLGQDAIALVELQEHERRVLMDEALAGRLYTPELALVLQWVRLNGKAVEDQCNCVGGGSLPCADCGAGC